MSVLLGNGGGTFLPATNFTVGGTPISVAIGDLNGDAKPDLAVANEGSLNVSVLLGNRDGTFLAPANFALGAFPRSVAIGDLNGDGKPDLAIASRFPDIVSVLLGNGDGTFGTPTNFTAGIEPRSVAIGDLNGDGKPDLAVANGDGNPSTVDVVSVLLGNGDGTFLPATNFTVGGPSVHIAGGDRVVTIGDLNGDGKPDLTVVNGDNVFSTDDVVSVLLGNGDGTFLPATNFTVGDAPESVAIGDLNGDGNPDLVTANNSSDNVSILLNRTGGVGFLTFPLRNKTPFNAVINTVFDHSMNEHFCPDDVVTAYTGEEGRREFGVSKFSARFRDCDGDGRKDRLHGFKNATGTDFSVGGQYEGGGEPEFLFYDGHPGYDFRTKDQLRDGTLCPGGTLCSNGRTEVLAAASGIVTCARRHGCPEGPGAVRIDHRNGYSTVYLHLSRILVREGDEVTGGQTVIGISGAVGAKGNQHLHFEARLNEGNIPVDPYGWQGEGPDPYTRATNVNLWLGTP